MPYCCRSDLIFCLMHRLRIGRQKDQVLVYGCVQVLFTSLGAKKSAVVVFKNRIFPQFPSGSHFKRTSSLQVCSLAGGVDATVDYCVWCWSLSQLSQDTHTDTHTPSSHTLVATGSLACPDLLGLWQTELTAADSHIITYLYRISALCLLLEPFRQQDNNNNKLYCIIIVIIMEVSHGSCSSLFQSLTSFILLLCLF